MTSSETMITYDSVESVSDFLRHRPPFLFVDSAQVDRELLIAHGNYRFEKGSWFFPGHFPESPLVPGVILLEMAAQTANLLLSLRAGIGVKGYLINANNVAFKVPVLPEEDVTARIQFSGKPEIDEQMKPNTFFSFKASIRRGDVQCMRADLTLWWAD